jgi:hypothetical protein
MPAAVIEAAPCHAHKHLQGFTIANWFLQHWRFHLTNANVKYPPFRRNRVGDLP